MTKGSRKPGREVFDLPPSKAALRQEGRALRRRCSRSSHSTINVRRTRDPVALLEKSNEGRVEHLIPVRMTRMLESPFAFFRGTALLQANDLKGTPSAGITVQSCGDCHLMNFGLFASPERTLIFDINDFDETLPAPFEWDLKRLATSFVLAARWRGFGAKIAREVARTVGRAYRERMAEIYEMPVLQAWYARLSVVDFERQVGRDQTLRKRLKALAANASRHTSEVVFHKITREVRGRPRFVDQPPVLYHVDSTSLDVGKVVRPFFDNYRETLAADRRRLLDRYKLVDVAFKVVGVGSVGTFCYVSLWMADRSDPLLLQVKEARASVLEGLAGRSPQGHDGERVVTGQRLMQSASDIFLGWARGPTGRDFYVRQLQDMKASANVPTMSPRIMERYARVCGQTLARAHARSGEAPRLTGYLGSTGKFDDALAAYAVGYAAQVEKDYQSFRDAVRSGRLPSENVPSETEIALR